MSSIEIQSILEKHPGSRRDSLIPILQEVQEKDGYLSREAIVQVGAHLGLPASKIFGVATFYNQFRFQPQGRFHIQICRGTACHVKGSARVLDAFEQALEVVPGQTTRDGMFSLEVVACMGACGLAPVINVDGEFFAGVVPDEVKNILDTYRRKAADEAQTN